MNNISSSKEYEEVFAACQLVAGFQKINLSKPDQIDKSGAIFVIILKK